MLEQLRSDPMSAGLVWRLLVLMLAGLMYWLLRDPDADHEWWGSTMVRLKLSGDEQSAVASSRTFFRWLSIIMLVVTLVHIGQLIYRRHPAFAEKVQTDQTKPAELPKGYGAGGGGRMTPGQGGAASESGGAPRGRLDGVTEE